jgi:hypothetical protein
VTATVLEVVLVGAVTVPTDLEVVLVRVVTGEVCWWVVPGVSDSVTGQTVVERTTVSVVTWGPAGQLVTVGAHDVTV